MLALADIKKEYGTDRIIVVADKGLNSGDNIAFNTALGDGYVYSQSVRGASDLFNLNAEFNVAFGNKYMTLGEIKKILEWSKRADLYNNFLTN